MRAFGDLWRTTTAVLFGLVATMPSTGTAAPPEPEPSESGEPARDPELDALRSELETMRQRLDDMAEEQRRRDAEADKREQKRQADAAEAERTAEQAKAERARLQVELGRISEAQGQQQAENELHWHELDRFRLSGDFRFRTEHDWDSRFDDGSFRRDRFRFRYRLRLGLEFAATKTLSFGVVARTGVPTNMQSPHVNVGYNGYGMAPLNLGRAYARGDYRYLWWWVGKNTFPGFRQDEMFWDDDVTPEGVAMGGDVKVNDALAIRPTVAYFVPDHEQILDYPDSRMVFAQLWLPIHAGRHLDLDLAGSYMYTQRIFLTPQHLGRDLWDQGGPAGLRIDHDFIYSQARLTAKTKVKNYALPVVVGFDHVRNVEDYANVDAVPDHYKDQKNMYVANARIGHAAAIGGSSKRGDWYAGYTFAWKEHHSVVSYFGEDDWVRWGNIHRNRNTNYRGHEARGVLALGPHINLMLRLYFVRGLVRRLENDATTTETGSRVRLDLNVRF